jgi:hypothetical protein
MINFSISDIFTGLNQYSIGSKIVDLNKFLSHLRKVTEEHDFESDSVPGQALLAMPQEAVKTVTGGDGFRTRDLNDYVIRKHRGNVGLYLKRYRAENPKSLSVVIYTKEAYLRDPDIAGNEAQKISNEDPSHIIVAVLASVSEKTPPLSPYRFVHNLAGGNLEALKWTADEIRDKAKEIKINSDTGLCTVAD